MIVNEYSKSESDVRSWPTDAAARHALRSFFVELAAHDNFVPELVGRGLDFRGADLSGLQLAGVDWTSADLSGVEMKSSSLVDAWFLGARLIGTDFTGSNLRKAQFRGCSARDSILVGAQLNKTDMSDSDFRGADLHNTALDQAFMFHIDLRGANLAGCSLATQPWNADLSHARLNGATVKGMRGDVTYPIDIGAEEPNILEGRALQQWFADNGAPEVVVLDRTS
ncbi:pentapeptide repeat-containing protein [Rhodococcoides yunnanense]|uniref:pentapeptide repeat-containing protein n=1 Tax=Rhodococcoides yunnanense TaxID=278209 RepID=UPI001472DF9A|nr:pentapeptide repeat-containing protein [Rhodococcus yunnanensis]